VGWFLAALLLVLALLSYHNDTITDPYRPLAAGITKLGSQTGLRASTKVLLS